MTTLILGVLLWSIMHFLPATNPQVRKNLLARLGENAWKGIFALLMVLSIVRIYFGWKATIPVAAYQAPVWGRHLTALLMMAAFILFFAPYPPNNFKRFLRHPQLMGVFLWGVSHLLANGETRSIVLFGGMALWAILEILLIHRRDGSWSKPETAPINNDVVLVIIGLLVYAGVVFAHPWLFGVSPMA